jgi:hypothetical protein
LCWRLKRTEPLIDLFEELPKVFCTRGEKCVLCTSSCFQLVQVSLKFVVQNMNTSEKPTTQMLSDDAPPIVLTQLESLLNNKFQRNICLGKLNKDEIVLVRFFSLKNELIHNIPKYVSKTDIEVSVWKPNKTEKEFLFILVQFLQSSEHKLSLYQDIHIFDRMVAHYVAESLGLEHESNDTPDGRRMTFRKANGALKTSRSVSDSSTLSNGSTTTVTNEDLSAPNLARSDTWSSALSRSDTWNLTMLNHPPPLSTDFELINCDADFDDMTSIARIEHLTTPSSPDMSTDSNSKPPDVAQLTLPAQAAILDEFSLDEDMPPHIEGSPLSRQVSRRVITEVNELKQRVGQPSKLERITTGTGEVYLVVDSGTGERAIFKPASQLAQNKRSSVKGLFGIPSISETSSKSFSEESPLLEDKADEEIVTHRKEVAAYQLDHFGFAGVLPTMEVYIFRKR